MQVREFAKPVTANKLNESMAARFGTKLNLNKFTLEQLQDARNRIRTQLSQVETNESFDSVQNETYQKSKMMLDVLNAAISERGEIEEAAKPDFLDMDKDGNKKEPMKKAVADKKKKKIKEGAEDHAELVMAAKEMVDRITGWMEDTAEMQTESMLELADAIRDEMGQAASDAFTGMIKPALDSLYQTLDATRQSLNGGVSQLTGEGETPDMMGADDMSDMGDMEPVDDTDVDFDTNDDFGAAEPATGGEEPADRAKRESRQFTEKKSYSAKKAAAGKDIGKPGKNFSKIAKSAGEKYGSEEKGKKVAGAVLKKLRAKESIDATRLISLLSKKK